MLWKNAFGTIPNVNLLNIVDQTDPEASDEENRILETTFSTDFKSGMDSFPKSTKAESEPPLNIDSKNDENVLDDAPENNKNGSETEYKDAEDKEIGIEKYRDESKKAHQLIVKERIKNSSETEESKRAKKEEPEPLPFIPLEPPPKPRQDEFQFQQCELSTT